MVKMLIQTLGGIFANVSGIAAGYFYLDGLDEGGSILLLGLSFILVGVGVFLLLRGGKLADNIILRKDPSLATLVVSDVTGTETAQTLQQNNQMAQEWDKVNSHREKLKTVSLAAQSKSA